ncbi:MAG: glycosyltransferase family 2 protein [Candidatus Methylacidiphilales bacterium]|nr:glycosyltransferase family 2 protein [Candidatus Methylacidiphilales bacterium]
MKISIVTPSYNQADYLQATFDSVFQQPGPIEYVVVDGGSKDHSKAVIERNADRIAWWCSEKDKGQYDAINKGFSKTTGEVMAWLNSSDMYLPWTLQVVREIFEQYPQVDWISSTMKTCISDGTGFAGMQKVAGFSRRALWAGRHGSRTNRSFIQQESCFWRRSLWEKIGGSIPLTYRHAADMHLWALFFEHSPLTGVDAPLAAFRFHGDQRSTHTGYLDDVDKLLAAGPSGDGGAAPEPATVPQWNREIHGLIPVVADRPSADGSQQYTLRIRPTDEVIDESDELDNALSRKEKLIRDLDKDNRWLRQKGADDKVRMENHVVEQKQHLEDLRAELNSHPLLVAKRFLRKIRGKKESK